MASLYIGIILIFRVVQALFNKRSSMEVKNIPMLVGYNAYKNAISAALGLGLILFAAIVVAVVLVVRKVLRRRKAKKAAAAEAAKKETE